MYSMPTAPLAHPIDVWANILRFCDEPARDVAVGICQEMKTATDIARQTDYRQAAKQAGRLTREELPTTTELADRGCLRPHYANILRTMGLNKDSRGGPLTQFYRANIRLSEAIDGGCAGRIDKKIMHYAGGLVDGKKHGFGRFDNGKRGTYYEGFFQNNQYHGFGVERFGGTLSMEGTFKDGRLEGVAVKIMRDGSRYEGHFQAGVYHGQGKLMAPDSGSYEGNFREGHRDGLGLRLFPNGDAYMGGHYKNKMSGPGRYIWRGGDCFEGHALDGEFLDEGTYTVKGGQSIRATLAHVQRQRRLHVASLPACRRPSIVVRPFFMVYEPFKDRAL